MSEYRTQHEQRIVVLVGTSHIYQKAKMPCTPQHAQAFRCFLLKMCRQYCIKTVAEEMSEEALQEDGIDRSVPQQVALEELVLPYLFCDPNREERCKRGIMPDTYIKAKGDLTPEDEIQRQIQDEHIKRERYWLERLKTVTQWPVLFICGADHVESFGGILKSTGFSVNCIANDWEPPS